MGMDRAKRRVVERSEEKRDGLKVKVGQMRKETHYCYECKGKVPQFRNKMAEDLYYISGMCPRCRDKAYGESYVDRDNFNALFDGVSDVYSEIKTIKGQLAMIVKMLAAVKGAVISVKRGV